MMEIFRRKLTMLCLGAAAMAATTASASAHVTLDAPNGGEQLNVGSLVTVQWVNAIPHSTLDWDLWYSTSGAGGPWIPIAMDLPVGNPAAGSIHTYDWTVPSSPSTQVRVRVRQDNPGMDYEDISDADLTILACGTTGTYCTAGTTTNGCAAAIAGQGTPSASGASSFVVGVSGVEGQKQGLVFYGLSGASAAPWGTSSSFLCLKSPTQRTTAHSSGGTTGACDGALALDWNAFVAANPTALGVPFAAGQSVWAQGWFRDPPSPKTTSLSDGLAFTLCP